MRNWIVLAVLAGLAGCGSTHAMTQVSIAAACGTYANNLDNLAPIKHTLDKETLAAIATANSLADPVCLPGATPQDYAAAVSLVTQEAAAIYAIYQAHKGA